MTQQEQKARREIFKKVSAYYRKFHKKPAFRPGETFVNYGGRVYDEKELINLTDTALDFWLTSGRYCAEFERRLGAYLGVKHVSLVNSGSSANLIAFMALTSPKLGARQVRPGDEVITVAAGFPTTVTPIIQYGSVPVFVDVELPSYNIDCSLLEKARSRKTKAVMLAHTLGNPFDIAKVKAFCKRHNLWLIEDNCIDGDRCTVVRIDGKIRVMTVKEVYEAYHGSKYGTFEALSGGEVFREMEVGNFSAEFLNTLSRRQADISSLYARYHGDSGRICADLGISPASYYCSLGEIRKKMKAFTGVKPKWAPVTNVISKGKQDVWRITQNFGQTAVTADHRLMAVQNGELREVYARDFVKGGTPFLNVLLAKNGADREMDLLPYLEGHSQSNGAIKADRDWIWFEYSGNNWKGAMRELPKIKRRYRGSDLSSLCALFGMYCAEGNSGHEVRISSSDRDYVEQAGAAISAISNLNSVRISSAAPRPGAGVIRGVAVLSRKEVFSANLGHELFNVLFTTLAGAGSYDKRVPDFIFNLDREFIRSFYDAYVAGDGCRKSCGETDFVITTASRKMAAGVNLLNNLLFSRHSRFVISKGKYYDVAPVKALAYVKKRTNRAELVKDAEVFDITVEGTSTFVDACGNLLLHNCDALGSKYAGKFTGTFGDIGTSSFYPPHHMTMGEGGAVYTNDPLLKRLIESFRDWGRDCWCPSGHDNTCHARFTRKYGELPLGYDHKYVYSHFGYNLKATEMQAAVGLAQLDKFPRFVEGRRKNWAYLRKALEKYSDKLILPEPTSKSDPSWFGFLITVRENAGFNREQLVSHLEKNKVQTRMLFAGNLIKHPCFDEMRKSGKGYRTAGKLTNTDAILDRTFWVGVYPGMKPEMLKYMAKTFTDFLKAH